MVTVCINEVTERATGDVRVRVQRCRLCEIDSFFLCMCYRLTRPQTLADLLKDTLDDAVGHVGVG